jgi:hypothetical protein
VDVHGGVDVPAPRPAPPPAQTTSSPLLVTVVADSGLGASAALRCATLLLGSTQRWCAFSLPLTARSLVKKGKTPMAIGGLGARVSAFPCL